MVAFWDFTLLMTMREGLSGGPLASSSSSLHGVACVELVYTLHIYSRPLLIHV